jgi:hypothetical protein
MADDDFNPDLSNFPPELRERFMSFIRVKPGGEAEVVDEPGFFAFVDEHREKYPFLSKLVKLNEAAVEEHFSKTGEIPAGIKGIRKTTQEGSNVTKVEIFFGPTRPPEE